MPLSIPGDELQAEMDAIHLRKREANLRAVEEQRVRDEDDTTMRKLLIEAEATMRFEIENDYDTNIEEIKQKIKENPNMDRIELRNLLTGYAYCQNEYKCTSVNTCRICENMRLFYETNPIALRRNDLIQDTIRRIHYEYIDQRIQEVRNENT